MEKTIQEINKRIETKRARVVTADEMTRIVAEQGPEKAAEQVDVVTTGTFGAMCSSGVWLNFGHSDPPIKMIRVWLNDVEAYAGVAAVDAYLGVTQASETLGMTYSGAHVIEDLLQRKPVVVRTVSCGTDCYPLKELVTEITLADLNQAIMSNPRNAYQRYNAASNSSDRELQTYMGKLLSRNENVTFSGAGELSPLMNDPDYQTIGIGTRIFLGGGIGYVTGSGTQHNPKFQFGTLMVQGDLKGMSLEFLRAAVFPGYGGSMYIGIGIPIPVLSADIAKKTGIADRDIETNIIDYSVASRNRPILGKANYEQLKTGHVQLNGKEVPASPLASFRKAKQVAETLKNWIEAGKFILTEAIEPLPKEVTVQPMIQKTPADRSPQFYQRHGETDPTCSNGYLSWNERKCISCGQCLGICPAGVYRRNDEWTISADLDPCTRCGQCKNVCPVQAIIYEDHGR